jgi:hypothetical protein
MLGTFVVGVHMPHGGHRCITFFAFAHLVCRGWSDVTGRLRWCLLRLHVPGLLQLIADSAMAMVVIFRIWIR